MLYIFIIYHFLKKIKKKVEKMLQWWYNNEKKKRKRGNTVFFWIALAILGVFVLATLVTAFVCFIRIFYSPKRKISDEFEIPDGKIYEEYREVMIDWMRWVRGLPCRSFSIRSYDALMLRGRYFECKQGAPIELLFHGYKGSAERDLCGGVARCFALGHNVMIVDHRASGESEGHVISFGINESRDCAAWVNLILREIDPDAEIILAGISMGAATVLIASGKELPENVVGVVADCGYTSAKEIIKKVIREMGLPADLLYPFARLGAKIFGHFDLEETSPREAMKNCKLPVIFFHGDVDDFVPHAMSEENFAACGAKKRLVTVKGAGHGLAFPVDQTLYLRELKEFFGK